MFRPPRFTVRTLTALGLLAQGVQLHALAPDDARVGRQLTGEPILAAELKTARDFFMATFEPGADLEGARLSGIRFDACGFAGVRLRGATFDQCALDRSDFSGTALEDVVFKDCKLEAVSLRRADLSRTDFTRSSLVRPDLAGARFSRLQSLEGSWYPPKPEAEPDPEAPTPPGARPRRDQVPMAEWTPPKGLTLASAGSPMNAVSPVAARRSSTLTTHSLAVPAKAAGALPPLAPAAGAGPGAARSPQAGPRSPLRLPALEADPVWEAGAKPEREGKGPGFRADILKRLLDVSGPVPPWEEQLQLFKDFIEAHPGRRLPGKVERIHVRLYVWVNHWRGLDPSREPGEQVRKARFMEVYRRYEAAMVPDHAEDLTSKGTATWEAQFFQFASFVEHLPGKPVPMKLGGTRNPMWNWLDHNLRASRKALRPEARERMARFRKLYRKYQAGLAEPPSDDLAPPAAAGPGALGPGPGAGAGQASELKLPQPGRRADDAVWNQRLSQLAAFLARPAGAGRGHLAPAVKAWAAAQKWLHNSGNPALTAERKAALERLPGWTWTKSDNNDAVRNQSTWDRHLEALKAYASAHRTTRTGKGEVTPGGLKLGAWVATQRAQKHSGNTRLTPARIAALEGVPHWTW